MRGLMFRLFFFFVTMLLPLGSLLSHPLDSVTGAEDLLKALSLDEKIGQLFIVGAYSNTEDARLEGQTEDPKIYVERMIAKAHIGGAIFKMRWDPKSLHDYIQELGKQSAIPLLTLQDLEWGLNQRHATALRFPRNMTLGAIQDESLIYELGREIGREARLVGINCNLAPCVDVNSNPQNPVIGDRSFGDNPEKVARRGCAFARGLQEEGVAACAKHFPGHGDTAQDSHSHLPTISRTYEELKTCDLVPFQALSEEVMMMMTAHIVVPTLDPQPGQPATFSRKITHNLLKKEMGFSGLVISDDLLMKAISERATPEEAALGTFQAGCDLILSSRDIEREIQSIKDAVKGGTIREADINAKVLKILKLKLWIRQNRDPAPEVLDEASLFPEKAKILKANLYSSAITVKNKFNLPAPTLIIQIGGTQPALFCDEMHLPSIFLNPEPTPQELGEALSAISKASSVLITFFDMRPKSNAWGVNITRRATDAWTLKKPILDFLQEVRATKKPYGFVSFVSPYIKQFLHDDEPICFAFEDDPDAQKAAAHVILGTIKAEGELPIR